MLTNVCAVLEQDCKSKNEVLPEELPFDESDECPTGSSHMDIFRISMCGSNYHVSVRKDIFTVDRFDFDSLGVIAPYLMSVGWASHIGTFCC